MKRILLLAVTLLLSLPLFAQAPEVTWIAGLRGGTRLGLEGGIALNNRVGVKVIGQCDWRYLNLKSSTIEELNGKKYSLMYGGAVTVRVAGPVWMSLEAGYAWTGKYAYDEVNQQKAVVDHMKGLDLGLEAVWVFSYPFYVSLGYETMPVGFVRGAPVHDFHIGFGMMY